MINEVDVLICDYEFIVELSRHTSVKIDQSPSCCGPPILSITMIYIGSMKFLLQPLYRVSDRLELIPNYKQGRWRTALLRAVKIHGRCTDDVQMTYGRCMDDIRHPWAIWCQNPGNHVICMSSVCHPYIVRTSSVHLWHPSQQAIHSFPFKEQRQLC